MYERQELEIPWISKYFQLSDLLTKKRSPFNTHKIVLQECKIPLDC